VQCAKFHTRDFSDFQRTHLYDSHFLVIVCMQEEIFFVFVGSCFVSRRYSRLSFEIFPHCADYKLDYYYYYFSSFKTFLLISSSFLCDDGLVKPSFLNFSFMTVGFISSNGKAKFML